MTIFTDIEEWFSLIAELINNVNLKKGQILLIFLINSILSKKKLYIRGLSGKYADTVNTEAKTSNNMELFFIIFSQIILFNTLRHTPGHIAFYNK